MTRIFPKQSFRHDPANGVYGDCHRTALACLMGLEPEEIPNFGDGLPDAAEFNHRIRVFLRSRGLAEFTVGFDCDLETLLAYMDRCNAGQFWILGGMSRNGVNHSVLCRGGTIIHDPSLDDSGIVGPMDDGFYRSSVVIVQPHGFE